MPAPLDRVNAALRLILEDCCGSADPLTCLTEHLDRIKSDPRWERDGVVEVERTATRILSALLDR